MATELGQAYVQIMPSAKGISGSIQKTINPEATAAGKSAGSRIASSIASSMGSAGKSLTKAITVPALGAATAVGGIVAAFGWKRLVGLDSARAKLQGLGYDAQSVERISDQVKSAVQGTVTTMAEGVSIAAGGLAAGVKEGAELEKYIKLVGDAAVGANRPVNDMAQIFNRVQGSGKLMTQELNMIEDGMPGFAMAMSKSLGVSQEEFRKMVTAGEVSSEQFLGVMDSFAGEMSGAYAKSWEGMVSNTKAWIGIIGENILGGVFEQSKETIAEFMEFLKSDDIQAWAKETGQTIGDSFSRMIESIKGAIEWWTGLSDGTKSLITNIAGIAVAIGPVLMILSKLIFAVMTVGKWFGLIKVAAGIVGTALGAISAPVLIVIGIIAGLIAVFVALYKNNEGFRDLVQTVWATIKETFFTVIQAISDFVMEIFGALVEWWNANNEQIFETVMNVWQSIVDVIMIAVGSIVEFVKEIWSGLVTFWTEHGQMIFDAAQNVWNVISSVIKKAVEGIWNGIQIMANIVLGIMEFLWPFIKLLILDTWNAIKNVIQGAIDVILGIIQFFSALFTGNWSAMWDSIKQIISGAVQLVWGLINLWFVGKILKAGKALFTGLRSIVSSMWTTIRSLFTSGVNTARSVVSSGFNFIRSIISSVMNAIRSVISSVWNGIRSTISSVVNGIRSTISNIFNSLRGIVSGAFNGVRSAVSNGMTSAFNTVKGFLGKFKDAGKNIVTSIADGIKGAISKVTDAIGGVVSKVRDFLPFSPAKEGPLKDLDKLNFGGTISMGIDDGADDVQKAMEDMLGFDLSKKAKFNDYRNNSTFAQTTEEKQPIILQVDGKTFAQIIGDYTNQEGGKRIRRMERGLA